MVALIPTYLPCNWHLLSSRLTGGTYCLHDDDDEEEQEEESKDSWYGWAAMHPPQSSLLSHHDIGGRVVPEKKKKIAALMQSWILLTSSSCLGVLSRLPLSDYYISQIQKRWFSLLKKNYESAAVYFMSKESSHLGPKKLVSVMQFKFLLNRHSDRE